MNQENLFGAENEKKDSGPVDCLGMTFESDEARRTHFIEQLREKLKDPEFRSIEGFPIGTDEAILELSDPPYYTVCPNPWMDELVKQWESEKVITDEEYHREPVSVDVSVGKTDPLYMAHSYHTKVPHKAIVPSILHYTKPGDIVLDGFSGSGMTGVAAQWCQKPTAEFKNEIEKQNVQEGRELPEWGARKVVLNDLSPAASFIGANYNTPFNTNEFFQAGIDLLDEVGRELGWMYTTLHSDGETEVPIEYTVWSQVFSCSHCAAEINFFKEALDHENKLVKSEFNCPSCSASLNKKSLNKVLVSKFDLEINDNVEVIKREPVLICYKLGKSRVEKEPDENDLRILKLIENTRIESDFPKHILPVMHMTHERARMDYSGITHVHHFFEKRALISLSLLWSKANAYPSDRIRSFLLYWLDQSIWGFSLLNRYRLRAYSHVNQYLTGVYYVPSQNAEPSPRYNLENKLKRLSKVFSDFKPKYNNAVVSCGSVTSLGVSDSSIDYIFTDPPFGENIYYSDLNYLVESWHKVTTNAQKEAIVDRCRKKEISDYQRLMALAFKEYYRVLKEGHWMTVVFSNSKAAVWNAIQVALQQAGFVVAEVTALDKKQGSYRQVTSTTAVKQDLVISAYKPTSDLEKRFCVSDGSEVAVWDFVKAHLEFLPIVKTQSGEISFMPERSAKVLFDRTVAWFIKHNKLVPISASEFHQRLSVDYVERDGMFFLADQVSVYDKKRSNTNSPTQLSILIEDEISTIEWLKQMLKFKPMTQQDIQPIFLREITSWNKNEQLLELREILEHNFLKYDGMDEVPSQIHTYLSTNFKDMRGLDKSDPKLVAKAKDRWFVPDPNKAADLEKVRFRALLKEFETYKESKKKIKQPRAEALRAGFNTAWEAQDFQTILDISAKIPPAVLQEDEKLLMFYDNALTLTSTEDDEW
ncbi:MULTISPECIES: DNA methyltransferase [unclassified Vibrio]|uniref:DNA methyltransferase n=1 Tax=unclassified Vibrio TaxID=2614977 RepID=UPI001A90A5D5|nr:MULTISPECIES: DNA methyltransferase [unclassified Vibrio]MBO0244957.1 DNA methylase [Vibrio sp. Vb0592]MDW1735447.1 DNA methyltransferase [Vibrio sp. Vb2235]MDW1787719.1 DNA methyltransferase [Vibrio sp. Vb2227]MDW1817336.1 DNA methyltransferase [Vibrio sp. Vb2232]MDW1866893.1 DNA methyltransferase [Vibrio sp. Vb1127]